MGNNRTDTKTNNSFQWLLGQAFIEISEVHNAFIELEANSLQNSLLRSILCAVIIAIVIVVCFIVVVVVVVVVTIIVVIRSSNSLQNP